MDLAEQTCGTKSVAARRVESAARHDALSANQDVAASVGYFGTRAQLMTRHFSRRIVNHVLVVIVSLVAITIAATSVTGPIVAGIAASIPGPFHLAMKKSPAGARPDKPKLARAPTGCRLRSAPCNGRWTGYSSRLRLPYHETPHPWGRWPLLTNDQKVFRTYGPNGSAWKCERNGVSAHALETASERTDRVRATEDSHDSRTRNHPHAPRLRLD